MLFLVRTALTRHLGGMGSVRLYKHSHVGTKQLIEKYIEVALETLTTLLDVTRRPGMSDFDSRHILDQMLQARQAFGRSALLLSGGGTFGMNHIGVVKSLWDAKLLPRIISGASAGSIVCAVLCTRTDEEIPAVMDEFCFGDLDVFTKGDEVLISRQLARFLKHGSLFDIGNLQRVMSNLLGDMTFQEAYNRTRRILNICVSSASVYELPRLLNYITAPNVVIWSAVMSSCSVPLVFSPAPLLAKDPQTGELHDWNPNTQAWIDGSVDNDLPMTRLAELFNVNHFIVSQVNPHVVPFLDREEEGPIYRTTETQPVRQPGPSWLHTLADVARTEALHRMHILSELGVFPTLMSKTTSILNQKYSGDITILPEVSFSQFPKVLRNPNPEFMIRASLAGERATWPKLSRIQNHCAIELALDDAVQQLRARVAFSPSQVNLRLGVMEKPSHAQPARPDATSTHADKARTPSRPGMRISKSFAVPYTGTSPSGNNLPTSTNPNNSAKRTARPHLSLRTRRSFKHNLNSPSPDVNPSEEEKMFSTTPMDSSEDDAGYEESLDTEASDDDYFSLSAKPSHDDESATSRPARLFPHASQPNTPLSRPRTSTPGPVSSSTKRPPTPRPTTGGHVPPFGLSMMPAHVAPPSPQRSHAHQSQLQGLGRGSPLTPNTPVSYHQGSDVSGTRGMMMRKKRSISAMSAPGLKDGT